MAGRIKDRSARTTREYSIDAGRVAVVLFGLLYPILLLWALRDFVAPTFWYMGYVWIPPASWLFGVFSVFLAFIPVVFLPTRGIRPGTVILWILFVIAYVPIQIIPSYSSGKGFVDLYPMQMSVLLGYAIIVTMSYLPVIRIPSLAVPSSVYFGAMALLSVVILALALGSYGIPTKLPSLTNVYDVRAEFRDQNRGINFFVLLLVSWEQKVINPLLIAYGLVNRRWMVFGFGVLGQLILFGINGQKSVFFSGFLVVAVLVAMVGRGRWLGAMVMMGAVLLVITTAALDFISNSVGFTSLFVRRLILTPGMLTGYYFDFFSTSPQVWLSNSVLAPLFDYPYGASIPRVIGVTYFGRPELAANANIWADAFANFGVAGVLAFSFILGCVIFLFNSLAMDRNLLVTSALAGMAAWTLTDTALFVGLNTHGILFSLMLVTLLPRENASRASRKTFSIRRRQDPYHLGRRSRSRSGRCGLDWREASVT